METKRARYVLLLFALFTIGILYHTKSYAVYKEEGIDKFPKTYQPYLQILQGKYPNWTFTALYTGLDWKYVIDQENIFGKNLVPKSYIDTWKNTTPRAI